jgi:hypothetical protein
VTQDTRFTIAVVPDTQNYVSYDHQRAEGFPFDACEQLFAQFRYIAEQLRGAGYEMPTVKQAFELIAGKVPLCVVVGNHDYDALWTDSRHPPTDTTGPLSPEDAGMTYAGGLDNFRAVLGADTPFFVDQPWYVAWNDGGADSAQLFEAGGYRFLNLGLRFNAPKCLAGVGGVGAGGPPGPADDPDHP